MGLGLSAAGAAVAVVLIKKVYTQCKKTNERILRENRELALRETQPTLFRRGNKKKGDKGKVAEYIGLDRN